MSWKLNEFNVCNVLARNKHAVYGKVAPFPCTYFIPTSDEKKAFYCLCFRSGHLGSLFQSHLHLLITTSRCSQNTLISYENHSANQFLCSWKPSLAIQILRNNTVWWTTWFSVIHIYANTQYYICFTTYCHPLSFIVSHIYCYVLAWLRLTGNQPVRHTVLFLNVLFGIIRKPKTSERPTFKFY